MKIGSTFTKRISKRISLAVISLTFLMTGFAPALAGATSTGGATAPSSTSSSNTPGYCGTDPKPDLGEKPAEAAADASAKDKKAADKAIKTWTTKKLKQIPMIPACMVVYSSQGKYKQVVVSMNVDNTNQPNDYKTAKCNGKKFVVGKDTPKDVTFKIGKTPTILKCSAGNYNVYYLKKGQKAKVNQPSTYAAVGLQQHHCSYVHKSGVNRVEALNDDGTCPMEDQDQVDAADRSTPVLSVTYANVPAGTANTIVRGQKMTYTIEMKSADPVNDPLSFEDCAGVVNQKSTWNTTDSKAKIDEKADNDVAFRLNTKTKTCMFQFRKSAKQNNSKDGYYAGFISGTKNVTFSGNNTQNPATASTTVSFTDKK